jgi:hypothetical protein
MQVAPAGQQHVKNRPHDFSTNRRMRRLGRAQRNPTIARGRGCRRGIEIEIQIEIVIRGRGGQFDFDTDFDFDDD